MGENLPKQIWGCKGRGKEGKKEEKTTK